MAKLIYFVFAILSVVGTARLALGLRTEHISTSPGYIVAWEITDASTRNATITFDLTVQTTGFVGFGISKNGGMGGADIVIGGVFPNGTAYFSDRYAPGNGFPPVDTSQDWVLHSALENDTHTVLRVSRLLDTCDLEGDVVITRDTFRYIWSIGATDDIEYHGSDNRGSYAVNILADAYPDVDLSLFDTFDAITNITLPSKDTTYWCTVHRSPVFNGKQHAVAFGPVLLGPASKHSHHLSLYSCTPPEGEDPVEFFEKYITQGGIDCLEPEPGSISAYRYCTELVYTFTIGGRIMHMPEGVGFPIGEDTNMYYLMESHFDNPDQLSDVTFETGVRIYHTSDLRPIEAGVMRIGQMYDYNFVIPPSSTNYVVVGHCSSNCTSQWVPAEGVDIFNVMLHSHAYGTKMKVRQFRNGTEQPWVLNDDNYDNDYQDNRNIPLVKFMPGDQMAIECHYDNSMLSPPSGVLGGFGTRREMCEVVYYYYPKMGLENCRSNILKQNILNFFGVSVEEIDDSLTNPIITAPPPLAGLRFLEYINLIVWNDVVRGQLEQLMRYSLHEEQCGGDGFQKMAQEETYYVTYPEIVEEYVPPNSECPTQN